MLPVYIRRPEAKWALMNKLPHSQVRQGSPTAKPEWIRVSQTTQIFGIGRTKIYELIAQGKIKTASIKSRGNVRGTRLISYDSVAELINGCIVTINEEGAA